MNEYAVVIGVDHYKPISKLGLRPLNGAINDAEAMAKWLLDNQMIPKENLSLLTSESGLSRVLVDQVNKSLIEITKKVLKQGGDANRFYFYFAGHGMGLQDNAEENALCMSDWDEYNGDIAALSFLGIKRKFMSEGLFKEIVILLDCCRTNHYNISPSPGPGKKFEGKNPNPKCFVGYATTYKNAAFEAAKRVDTENRGIFTRVLLSGLSGGAGDNGVVHVENLIDYLEFHVPKVAQEAGFDQKPEFWRNTSLKNNIFFSKS